MYLRYFLLLIGLSFFHLNGFAIPAEILPELKENQFTKAQQKDQIPQVKVKSKKIKKMKKSKKDKKKFTFTLGRLSLGLGILGALLIWQPILSFFGLLLSIGALVVGILALKKEGKKKSAKWGVVLGSLGLLYFLSIFALILFV